MSARKGKHWGDSWLDDVCIVLSGGGLDHVRASSMHGNHRQITVHFNCGPGLGETAEMLCTVQRLLVYSQSVAHTWHNTASDPE